MAALLLRLMLILSLALNSAGGGMAMPDAHAAHGAGHAQPAGEAGPASADLHAHHHASTEAAGTQPAPDSPTGERAESCCDDAACRCGCMLPPMVALAAHVDPPVAVALLQPKRPDAADGTRHDRPPFRPPAA